MELDELKAIIQGAGGGQFTVNYADELLEKINRLESTNGYKDLLAQLRSAKEEGDFRGRVLEVNFANLFVKHGIDLRYGARQGMSGDVDFCWDLKCCQAFIEMKLLGQDQKTKETINKELAAKGFNVTVISDDTWDVARIQRDIFQKSSTRKFNPKPPPNWINLLAIDVSELQLGAVDICDCLVATVGNDYASRHCNPACLRPAVVGVFELGDMASLSTEQIQWVNGYHAILGAAQHPRDYIHGILFLFREPKERAALSYKLSAAVIWNPALVDIQMGTKFCEAFHQIVPCSNV